MRAKRVKVSESRTLARKRKIGARARRRKGGLYRERRDDNIASRRLLSCIFILDSPVLQLSKPPEINLVARTACHQATCMKSNHFCWRRAARLLSTGFSANEWMYTHKEGFCASTLKQLTWVSSGTLFYHRFKVQIVFWICLGPIFSIEIDGFTQLY